MSRVRSVLVGLIIALATLLTWEVGAAVVHARSGKVPPSTTSATVVP